MPLLTVAGSGFLQYSAGQHVPESQIILLLNTPYGIDVPLRILPTSVNLEPTSPDR